MAKLDFILVTVQNMFREKSGPKAKPDEQWQPEVVKEAKETARREKHRKLTDEELAAVKNYWRRHNDKARYIDD